jgi:hypothetical protein
LAADYRIFDFPASSIELCSDNLEGSFGA